MRLKPQRIRIQAPRELVFDVIASAGKEIGDAEGERLVEFETRWRGRSYKSTEAVSLQRPDRIGYTWLIGPLVDVEEEIMFTEIDPRTTQLMYRGSFAPPAGVTGWFRSVTVVRPIFNRLVRNHLQEAKKLSEARALRSRIYPS